MAISRSLQLVLVTPETTLLDEPVESLRFPLYDGQIGILPGRAPLVGRLGAGELRIGTRAGEQRYFIDGGFVQVSGAVVSLLTNGAVPATQIDAQAAEAELQAAQRKSARTDVELAVKAADENRARRKLAVARRH